MVLILFRGRLKDVLGDLDPDQLLMIAAAVLALRALSLLAAAMTRSQRARLILS